MAQTRTSFEKAVEFYQNGLFEDARNETLAALEGNPSDPSSLNLLALTHLAENRSGAALAALFGASKASSTPLQTEFLLGKTLLDQGYPAEACAPLRVALQRHPDSPEVIVSLATACKLAGHFDEAVELLERHSQYPEVSALIPPCKAAHLEHLFTKHSPDLHGLDLEPRTNWVLVCGALRSPEAFLEILRPVLQWRAMGLVHGIVLSTWRGEVKSGSDVHAFLVQNQIHVVECTDPGSDWFRTEKFRNNSFFRQMVQLHHGLAACPRDTYVLKIRTDKINIECVDPCLFFRDMSVPNDCPPIFEKRVCVEYGQLLNPITVSDMTYYGWRDDLKKLVNFDLVYEALYSKSEDGFDPFLNEDRLHLNVFAKHFPILESYYSRMNSYSRRFPDHSDGTPLSAGQQEAFLAALLEVDLASEFYLQFIATYFYILSRYFLIGMRPFITRNLSRIYHNQLREVSIMAIFSTHQAQKVFLHVGKENPERHTIVFNNSIWLSALLGGHFERDEIYYRFMKIFDKISDKCFHLSYADSLANPNWQADDYAQSLKVTAQGLFPQRAAPSSN